MDEDSGGDVGPELFFLRSPKSRDRSEVLAGMCRAPSSSETREPFIEALDSEPCDMLVAIVCADEEETVRSPRLCSRAEPLSAVAERGLSAPGRDSPRELGAALWLSVVAERMRGSGGTGSGTGSAPDAEPGLDW